MSNFTPSILVTTAKQLKKPFPFKMFWVDAWIFNTTEDFLEHCRELFREEEDAMFRFTDYMDIPRPLRRGMSNGKGLDAVIEFANFVENHEEVYYEAFIAGVELGLALEDIPEAYAGHHRGDEELAWEEAYSTYDIKQLDHWPFNCIDWKKAAQLLMTGYLKQDGYYFKVT